MYPLGLWTHPKVISSTPKYIIEISIFGIWSIPHNPTIWYASIWYASIKAVIMRKALMETAENASFAKIVNKNNIIYQGGWQTLTAPLKT